MVLSMELKAASGARRMVRSFSASPLDPGAVDSLLDLAVRAPAAGNTDGRAFVVLEGPDQTARYWQAATTADWRKRSRRFAGLARAPVVVVVVVSPDRYMARYAEPDKASSGLGPEAGQGAWPVPYWFFDAGASVMAMLLGACDAGIGACLMGNFRQEAELLEALGVDPSWRLAGAVVLGEPQGEDPPSQSLARPKTLRTVHRGSWGN